jgi:hypothetical protein
MESNQTRTYRRKASANIRTKLILDCSSVSPTKFRPRQTQREMSPRKLEVTQQVLPTFYDRTPDNMMTKKIIKPAIA